MPNVKYRNGEAPDMVYCQNFGPRHPKTEILGKASMMESIPASLLRASFKEMVGNRRGRRLSFEIHVSDCFFCFKWKKWDEISLIAHKPLQA